MKRTLNNNVEIPVLGFGVYQSKPGEVTVDSVLQALNVGYRHIDTAQVYGNEKDVATAIGDSGIPRDEIFVTTKLWNGDQGYDQALAAFDQSEKKLKKIDLYLLHFPVQGKRLESWRALERLYKEKRVRAIGVSNFTTKHLDELLANCEIPPAVNQVEFSPYLYQRDLFTFCENHGIQVEAYSPLTRGQKLADPRLKEIGKRWNKTPAQILLRWGIQHGLVVLPKSNRPQRILENSKVFDFELDAAAMKTLDNLNENLRTCWDPTDIP